MIVLHLMTFYFNLEFICKSEKWSLIITCPVTAAAQKVALLCTWEGNQAAAFWCNSCWSCLFPPFQFPAVFLPQHLWNACSHSGVCNHRLEPFTDAFGYFCHNAGRHPLEQPWTNQFLIFFCFWEKCAQLCFIRRQPACICLWSFVLFLSFHVSMCVNVILIALLPETVSLSTPFLMIESYQDPAWGWCEGLFAGVGRVDSLMPHSWWQGRHITFRLVVTQWCYRIRWHFTAQVIKIDWACSSSRKRCRRTNTGTVLV